MPVLLGRLWAAHAALCRSNPSGQTHGASFSAGNWAWLGCCPWVCSGALPKSTLQHRLVHKQHCWWTSWDLRISSDLHLSSAVDDTYSAWEFPFTLSGAGGVHSCTWESKGSRTHWSQQRLWIWSCFCPITAGVFEICKPEKPTSFP